MYVTQYAPTAARHLPGDTPKVQVFSLKTPYMKQGRITRWVAETPKLRVGMKVNAVGGGGENELHTHLDEDHTFILLEGQLSIFDETGKEYVLQPYQGVLLPAGAYYRYLNTGNVNAVFLRIGHLDRDPNQPRQARINTEGQPSLEGTVENGWVDPVEDSRFFAENS